jgi:VWFA-related protein
MLSLALTFATLCYVGAQIPSPTFTSDVKLVHLDIQVTERHTGRILRSLTKEDFEIQDNDETRDIAVFEGEAVPLDAVLLMDTTGQIGRNPWGDYSEGLQAIVKQLRSGDRLAVISVGANKVFVRTGLTSDEGLITEAILQTLRDRAKLRRGRSLLYESLGEAAGLFGAKTPQVRRRVVIALTHNRAKPNQKKISRTTTALLEADATVLGLVVPGLEVRRGFRSQGVVLFPRPRTVYDESVPAGPEVLPEEHSLEPVAEDTGGELLRYGLNMVFAWSDVIDRLRSRYMAAFYAPASAKSGETRRITVRLTEAARKCGDCIVRARARYTVK